MPVLSVRDWDAALPWLQQSGLALYAWSRMKSNPAGQDIPQNISLRLDELAARNRIRLAVMADEFKTLVGILKGAGLPYAVLKGFALTPEYCPDPALRTQYDFDFLVMPESLETVDMLLKAGDFIRKPRGAKSGPATYFHKLRPPKPPKTLDESFSSGVYRTVEVHSHLWEPRAEKIHFPVPDDSLRRARPKTENGLAFSTLAPEEGLLFQVLHTLRHILNNWCRLSHLFELANFIFRHLQDDPVWPAFESLVQRDERLSEASGVVFSLAMGLFEVPLAPAIRAFTVDRLSAPARFWVQRYGMDSAFRNFAGSKSSLYLHQLFVDRRDDWKSIRTRRLFPVQMPRRVMDASDRTVQGRPVWRLARIGGLVRRTWFHASTAVQYACGLPEWRRVCSAPSAPSPPALQLDTASSNRPVQWNRIFRG